MKRIKDENIPACDTHEIHTTAIERAAENQPEGEALCELSEFFSIFADRTRLSILFAIEHAPLCVCDIAELLKTTKSAVSHQLKLLRQANLVRYEKRGKNVFYSLADQHVRDIIDKAFEHLNEN